MDDEREARLTIGQALQAAQQDESSGFDGRAAVLVGWAMVAEWVDEDGDRWLTKHNADPSGLPLTVWQERGYLHEALFGVWPTGDGDG